MILGIPIPVLNRYWPPARGWRPRSSGREWWQQPLSIFHEESLDNLVTERRKALMEPAHGVFSAFRMRIIGRVAIHVGKMRELLEIAVNRLEEPRRRSHIAVQIGRWLHRPCLGCLSAEEARPPVEAFRPWRAPASPSFKHTEPQQREAL